MKKKNKEGVTQRVSEDVTVAKTSTQTDVQEMMKHPIETIKKTSQHFIGSIK